MTNKIVERILQQSGVANLVEILSRDLEPTDLQSLLLTVFQHRARQLDPRRVLQQYENNAFTRPANINVRLSLELDLLALGLAEPLFEALELAPLAPLGAVSVLAPLNQNRVVSTARNTEVVSDATNILALECALRRRAARHCTTEKQQTVRLCASHRLVRAQQYKGPNLRAHFRMFSLCAAGRAHGNSGFELPALVEQVDFYLRLLMVIREQGYQFTSPRIAFTPLAAARECDILQDGVIAALRDEYPDILLEIDPNPDTTPGYYQWTRFKIYASDAAGTEFMIGDGGFTDWTQQLMSDRSERLLTSGIATERIATLFARNGQAQ